MSCQKLLNIIFSAISFITVMLHWEGESGLKMDAEAIDWVLK